MTDDRQAIGRADRLPDTKVSRTSLIGRPRHRPRDSKARGTCKAGDGFGPNGTTERL